MRKELNSKVHEKTGRAIFHEQATAENNRIDEEEVGLQTLLRTQLYTTRRSSKFI